MTDLANLINVPVPGSPRFEMDTSMAIARLRASLGPTGAPIFGNTTLSGLTLVGLSGVVKAVAGVLTGGATHSDLAGIGANDHHNQVHALVGADHTVSGLTTGYVLTALSATTFGFAAAAGSADALLLDQTTPQHVINGAPHFDAGIEIKAGQNLYFDGV
jgi:hypothetical protein